MVNIIRECSISNCASNIKTKGLCNKHYLRKWKQGAVSRQKSCSINLCESPMIAKELCESHYRRVLKYGSPHMTKRHFLYGISEYGSWQGIIQRCTNENNRAFKNYGKRLIVICSRWRKSFQAFIDDMGYRPTKGHTIDRKDNDRNYSCGKCEECINNDWPMNCRWSDRTTQKYNQRLSSKNKSGYRGVSYSKTSKRWRASIKKNYEVYNLGLFETKEAAAKAYDNKAIELYGEDAILNLLS